VLLDAGLFPQPLTDRKYTTICSWGVFNEDEKKDFGDRGSGWVDRRAALPRHSLELNFTTSVHTWRLELPEQAAWIYPDEWNGS
jgi:hypothetical protein